VETCCSYRKEEEARKKAEAEEQARKAEQRRREAEALRKLQERSKAPWAQAPPAPPPTAQASLAEIQKLEREKKAVSILLAPPPSLSLSDISTNNSYNTLQIVITGRTTTPAVVAATEIGSAKGSRSSSGSTHGFC
jgi:ATPase subunit of ABC transporter with duplicated ATPase domains